jgi:hypothetical protein
MTAYPVLDDCTNTAEVIGFAKSAEEAMAIYSAKMIENLGEDHGLTEPAMFAYRHPSSLSSKVAEDCPNGAFEPVFA